jgi:hypothetical protein
MKKVTKRRRHKTAKASRPTTPKHDVTIEIRRHVAAMSAEVLPQLRSVLEQPWHRYEAGGPRGFCHYAEIIWHYIVGPDNTVLFFAAGLVSRVKEHLERGGYRVRVDDRTRWLELERADQLLLRSPFLRDEQIALLQTVMRAPRGQLVAADRDDAARLIALICEFLPAARIFIVAKNNRNAEAVYRRLKRRIPADRPLFLDPLKAKGTPAGIYAGTPSFFAMANPDDWDVLLFVDTEAALASHSVDKLGEMEDQLRYCLVPVNSNLGNRTSFRIEELFGRPIHEPRADRPADVQVVVIDSPRLPWCPPAASLLERKRVRLWHHSERNDLVARMAISLAQGDAGLLNAVGLQATKRLRRSVRKGTHNDVVVLVETVEHGRELSKLLPDWQSAHKIPTGDGGLEELDDYSVPVSGATITTVAFAEMYGVTADVLIWAGGTDWPLSLDAFPREALAEDDSVLLVDIADAGQRCLDDWVQARINTYRAAGWSMAISGPPRGIKRAAAAHPESIEVTK